MQRATDKGESCLFASVLGNCRACIAAIMYMMSRYGFSLTFCMDYLKSKIHNLQIKQFFYNQLKALSAKMIKNSDTNKLINKDEMIIVSNTHINSQTYSKGLTIPQKVLSGRRKVVWIDETAKSQNSPKEKLT